MYLLRNNTVIQTETVVDDAMQHDLFLLTSMMGADNHVLLLKHLRVLQSGLLLHSHNTHLYNSPWREQVSRQAASSRSARVMKVCSAREITVGSEERGWINTNKFVCQSKISKAKFLQLFLKTSMWLTVTTKICSLM